MTAIRRGQESVALDQETFRRRFLARFVDPVFDQARGEVDHLADLAWDAYDHHRKAPHTRPAGAAFADPTRELSVDWIEARDAIRDAARAHADPGSPSRVLVVAGGARSEHTCPGEMSKTSRLVELAREIVAARHGFEVDLLDLSQLTSEYGRVIYPCKGCVSTAMPLCHWPCSCYPNHGLGGNPDPTTTGGKDAARAKAVELAGWSYPRHLAGRAFGVVVHGDADGVETLRRSLADWLRDMELVPAGAAAAMGRYIGYYEPYATSHDALDRDEAVQEEVRNAARALVAAVEALRRGETLDAGAAAQLRNPRPK